MASFVTVAQIPSRDIIHGGLATRCPDHLRFELDQSQNHSNSTRFGAVRANKPILAHALAIPIGNSKYKIDTMCILEYAHKRLPGCHFELQIELTVTI
jgi:hypothetical protein